MERASQPPPTGRCPPWSPEAVLAWCARARFEGALAFTRGEVRRLLPFRAGRVDTRALPAPAALDVIRWMIDGGVGTFELLRARAVPSSPPPPPPPEVVYVVDRGPRGTAAAAPADRTERLFVPSARVVSDSLRALGWAVAVVVLGVGFALALEQLTR